MGIQLTQITKDDDKKHDGDGDDEGGGGGGFLSFLCIGFRSRKHLDNSDDMKKDDEKNNNGPIAVEGKSFHNYVLHSVNLFA